MMNKLSKIRNQQDVLLQNVNKSIFVKFLVRKNAIKSHDRSIISPVIIFCQELIIDESFVVAECVEVEILGVGVGVLYTNSSHIPPSKKKRQLPYNQALNARRFNKNRINRK